MWKVHDYPKLSRKSLIMPMELFRVENKPFDTQPKVLYGNAIFMFTGLMTSDCSGTDTLYCIPIYFYGENASYLSSKLGNKILWLELEVRRHSPGYYN